MENKKELSPKEKREKVVTYILSKNYGDTIKNEELNQILEEDLNDEYGKIRFRHQMDKAKNKLYEKGYVIRSIYGIGYYILKPNQISSYTYRNFILKPMKSYKKADTILNNINTKNLSDNRLEEKNNALNLNTLLQRTSNNIIKNSNYYKKEGYYNNLKD